MLGSFNLWPPVSCASPHVCGSAIDWPQLCRTMTPETAFRCTRENRNTSSRCGYNRRSFKVISSINWGTITACKRSNNRNGRISSLSLNWPYKDFEKSISRKELSLKRARLQLHHHDMILQKTKLHWIIYELWGIRSLPLRHGFVMYTGEQNILSLSNIYSHD